MDPDKDRRCSPKHDIQDRRRGVGTLLNKKLGKVTTDNWINSVRHVIGIEQTFRRGFVTIANIQPIVDQMNEEDTPSESYLSGVEPLKKLNANSSPVH